MAELSAEEASRLARGFLTGKAAEAEVSRLQVAIQIDAKAALELLGQMQSALDDVAPAGLTRDQWAVVDSRVHALIQPRVKSGGLAIFAALFNLFKRKPKEDAGGTTRVKRRGGGAPEAVPVPAALPEPTPPPMQEAAPDFLGETMGMEDMAPIAAPASVPAAAAATPVAADSAIAEKAAKPSKPKRESPFSKPGVRWALASLLVLAGLGGSAWTFKDPLLGWWARFMAPKAPVLAVVPTPPPKPSGPPRRAMPGPGDQEEPLPAALREATPRPAGSWEQPQGVEAYVQPTITAPTRR